MPSYQEDSRFLQTIPPCPCRLSRSAGGLQTVEVINPRDRDQRLEQLLRKYHSSRRNRVIVFVLYKKEVRLTLQPDPVADESLCVPVEMLAIYPADRPSAHQGCP